MKAFNKRRKIAILLGLVAGLISTTIALQGIDSAAGIVFFPALGFFWFIGIVVFISLEEIVWGKRTGKIISVMILILLATILWGSAHHNTSEIRYCDGVRVDLYRGSLPEYCK